MNSISLRSRIYDECSYQYIYNYSFMMNVHLNTYIITVFNGIYYDNTGYNP
jgi:hypothetical protein